MGKERGYAGLSHGSHVVEFLFLALERGAQELLHLHTRRGPPPRPHLEESPITEIEDDQNGKQTLDHPSQ